jgi:hypothetical protein
MCIAVFLTSKVHKMGVEMLRLHGFEHRECLLDEEMRVLRGDSE